MLEGSFSSSRPTRRPGTTGEGFCDTCSCLIASTGFFPVNLVTSPFRAAVTAGSLFTHSCDRSSGFIRSSCACWCPNSLSAKVPFQRSTINWSRWTSTRPRLTLTLCFARSWFTVPMNSCPGSTWRSLGHLKRLSSVDARQGISDLCCTLASQRLSLLVAAGHIHHSEGIFVGFLATGQGVMW